MPLLALFRTTFRRTFLSPLSTRGHASASSSEPSPSQAASSSESTKHVVSSCPAGTVLTGLNYLKGQPPVLAKADEEYPAWLWELTKPKNTVLADHDDDGPGGKAEKRRLRQMHRQTLKDNNLFKAK